MIENLLITYAVFYLIFSWKLPVLLDWSNYFIVWHFPCDWKTTN